MNFIDLFSGCGGLSLGLLNAGLNGVLAIEKNVDAFATLKKNLLENPDSGRKSFSWDKDNIPQIPHDINELVNNHVYISYLKKLGVEKSIDLIVGGPPCQGFSLAGKRDPDDPRNQLVGAYLKVVGMIMPKYLLMENVKGINLKFKKNSKELSMAEKIKIDLRDMGYVTVSLLENSKSWGVPQSRTRFLLLGIRKDLFNSGYELKHIEDKLLTCVKQEIDDSSKRFREGKNLPYPVSVGNAISDLKICNSPDFKELVPASDAPGKLFKQLKYSSEGVKLSTYQKLMRNEVMNKNFIAGGMRLANHSILVKSRFIKILSDISSKEISEKYGLRAGYNIPQKYIEEQIKTKKHTISVLDKDRVSCTITTLPDDLLHYDEPRILTVRECARIQSFPDWYEFTGTYTTGGNRRKFSCPKYTQVGNAVPPLMAEGLGFFISQTLPKLVEVINEK